MSLKTLPALSPAPGVSNLSVLPDENAMARWEPEIHAAHEGDGAVISIYDEIGAGMFGDGVSSKRIAVALRSIGNQAVTVNINSPGGDFFEGVAIYNLLMEHPGAVEVKVLGLAASAASIIAMAGDTILVSRVGFLMIHNAWVTAQGNRHDLREASDFLAPFDAAMASLYATQAGVDASVSEVWMDAETWFNGDAAVEAGLATGILSDDQITDEPIAGLSSHILAERKAERVLRSGGMSAKAAKRLVAELKTDNRDGLSDATRDAGDVDLQPSLAALLETMQPRK